MLLVLNGRELGTEPLCASDEESSTVPVAIGPVEHVLRQRGKKRYRSPHG